MIHAVAVAGIHQFFLLSTGETGKRFVEHSAGSAGLRCVDLPGEDAVAAGPCACAAVGEGWGGNGRDLIVDYVHIADKEDIEVVGGGVNGVVEHSVEQEFGVCCTGSDLPHNLNEEITVEGGEQPLAIGAGGGGILLGTDVEEGYINRVTDAELIFTEQTDKAEWRGGWVSGWRCNPGRRGDGGECGSHCLLDLSIRILSRFRRAGSYEKQNQAKGPEKRRLFFHPRDYTRKAPSISERG